MKDYKSGWLIYIHFKTRFCLLQQTEINRNKRNLLGIWLPRLQNMHGSCTWDTRAKHPCVCVCACVGGTPASRHVQASLWQRLLLMHRLELPASCSVITVFVCMPAQICLGNYRFTSHKKKKKSKLTIQYICRRCCRKKKKLNKKTFVKFDLD